MPKIKRSVDVKATSPEAEANKPINDFIRRGSGSIFPRNVADNPTLRAMFERDDDDQNGGDDRGN